jgi:hypothetical protein
VIPQVRVQALALVQAERAEAPYLPDRLGAVAGTREEGSERFSSFMIIHRPSF